MKKSVYALGALALFLSIASSAFATVSFNSGAPTNPQPQFEFFCNPYSTAFFSGGYYSPAEGSLCTYALPFSSSLSVLSLYKGTVGNASVVESDIVTPGNSGGSTILQAGPNPYGGNQNDDFFAVAFPVSSQTDIDNAQSYFSGTLTGSATATNTPPASYNILTWKFGTPPPLIITADNQSITQGDPLPAFTGTISGFVVNDSSDITGQPSCGTTASDSNTPGDYPINCTVGTLASVNNHYSFGTFVAGVLHIAPAPAPLTVTADNQSINQGAALPVFTATITGFINGDTLATSDVTGSPACSTTVTDSNTPGDYPINCTVGTLASTQGHYTFNTFTPGVLHIAANNTPPDTQPPVITITNPAKDGVYAKTDSVFLTASVTDQSPLSTTTYWFGSKQINPALPLPLSSASTPSIQSVSVSATDSAGNTATSTVKFFVVRSTNSCLLDIVSILIAILRDHTFPDKVTLNQLISDCSALQHGQHGGGSDNDDHGGWGDGNH